MNSVDGVGLGLFSQLASMVFRDAISASSRCAGLVRPWGEFASAQLILTCVVGLVVFTTSGRSAKGQEPPSRALNQLVGEFPEPFSHISSTRELRDGRVVVVDARESQVWLLNFTKGTRTLVGAVGSGPREYRNPRFVYALPGDSSLVYDAGNSRFLIITPDGKAGGTVSPPGRRFHARAADDRGWVFGEGDPIAISSTGEPRLADSVSIERWNVANGVRDTIAFVQAEPVSRHLIAEGVPVSQLRTPFDSWNEWTVSPSGKLVVVHLRPYRVEYIDRVSRYLGPPIPYKPVALNVNERRAWLDERRRFAIGTSSPTRFELALRLSWPRFLPPFLYNAVKMSTDGNVWVRRVTRPNEPPSYDVIGSRGRVKMRVVLRPASMVVGFSSRFIYVVRADGDGLKYLQRFATF